MRIRKETLCDMVKRLNACRGYTDYEYITVGIYRLSDSGYGYSIVEVMNEGGGVRVVGSVYGMTARKCYCLICGLIESVQTKGE